MIEERSFPNLTKAAQVLAKELAGMLNSALDTRGHASLAVSGGRTPQTVFSQLRLLPVDWRRVTLTLTDERWVAPDKPESNEQLVRTFLLQGAARAAVFVPLYGGEEEPADGQAACESRLKQIKRPFDAVYLGMGEDGHFASLFPGDEAVFKEDSLCVAVPPAQTRLPRLSLTARTILDSRKIYLLFSGAEKHEIYERAKLEGPAIEMPVRLILHQTQVPVHVLTAP